MNQGASLKPRCQKRKGYVRLKEKGGWTPMIILEWKIAAQISTWHTVPTRKTELRGAGGRLASRKSPRDAVCFTAYA